MKLQDQTLSINEHKWVASYQKPTVWFPGNGQTAYITKEAKWFVQHWKKGTYLSGIPLEGVTTEEEALTALLKVAEPYMPITYLNPCPTP